MNIRTIAFGCDHAGIAFKKAILDFLIQKNYKILDFGTHNSASVDYPDFAHPTALAVESGKADFGILVCGSGNGVAIAANKHQGVRAALCWNTVLTALARQHNDANILAIPARFVPLETALEMMQVFLDTDFEGGRHQTRVDKIACGCDV
jgi:ribose 5-phosphate isomerase B